MLAGQDVLANTPTFTKDIIKWKFHAQCGVHIDFKASLIKLTNTAQKMKFSIRISSVNVSKCRGNFGFGHI